MCLDYVYGSGVASYRVFVGLEHGSDHRAVEARISFALQGMQAELCSLEEEADAPGGFEERDEGAVLRFSGEPLPVGRRWGGSLPEGLSREVAANLGAGRSVRLGRPMGGEVLSQKVLIFPGEG